MPLSAMTAIISCRRDREIESRELTQFSPTVLLLCGYAALPSENLEYRRSETYGTVAPTCRRGAECVNQTRKIPE